MVPSALLLVIIAAPAYLASNANDFYYGSSHIFGPETQLGADTEEIEEIFGKSDTYVLLVPKDDLVQQEALSDALHEIPEVSSIISYVDTVGMEIPTSYLDADTLSQLNSENYTRMVLSVDVAYEGTETFVLVEKIRAVAEEYYPGTWYLGGEGVSTYDLMDTITADMMSVNLIAIGAVFVVLIFALKSLVLPAVLVLSIESAIWINMAIPYFADSTIFYIAYLIISSIQLGATVSACTPSILTSGSVMTVVGFLLGGISTHGILSQLGTFLGKGTLCSMAIVLFALPCYLYLADVFVVWRFRREEQVAAGAIALAVAVGSTGASSILVEAAGSGNAGMSAGSTLSDMAVSIGEEKVPAAKNSASEGKEEVIYVMTDAAGKTTSLNVVNIFSAGDITDYGDYSEVKMLTSTENITQEKDKVTFHSDAEKVYYQGTMDVKTQLPWNIAITYTMDGKEVTPTEIAGSDGDLDIRIVIDRNENFEGDFYENYALQASFTLDTNLCRNIAAQNATLANVGADKQISFTVLPGKGLDAHITADVTDFEMDAVSINGVKMNLDVDIDDEELMDKVREIMDATAELNDGSTELVDGVSDLSDGASDLKDGAQELLDGAKELNDGASDLQDGAKSLAEGLGTLNGKTSDLTNGSAQVKSALGQLQSSVNGIAVDTSGVTALVAASSQIKSGITDADTGAHSLQEALSYTACKEAVKAASEGALDIDTVQSLNASTLETLQNSIAECATAMAALEQAAQIESEQYQTLAAMKQQYENTYQLIYANSQALAATGAYIDTVGSNAGALVAGLDTLNTSYGEFDSSIQTMSTSLSSMAKNEDSLKSGVNSIVSGFNSLDSGISSYTGGVSSALSGSNELYNGTKELKDGTAELVDGAQELLDGTGELVDGVSDLSDGADELKDGASEFYDKTYDMDSQVQDEIDEMLASISGDETETVSFVSEKNTDVASVQFVIKTDAIELPEEEAAEVVAAEPKSFWEKFVDLFK